MTIVWPIAGGVFVLTGGGLTVHTHTSRQEKRKECVKVRWWVLGGRQIQYLYLRMLGFSLSSSVKWLHLVAFLTFCHYCHFTWELGQRMGNTDSRLTPAAVHLIDISTDNDLFSALQWWLHREALGGGKYRRNVTPGKSARRKALPDERRVSGSSLPPLCPG